MLKAFVTLAKKGRTPSIENTWGKRYISASPIMEGRCFKEIWIFIQISFCPTIFVRYDRSVLVFTAKLLTGCGKKNPNLVFYEFFYQSGCIGKKKLIIITNQ